MKWKKFTLETTTDAVDYLGSMFDDIGIEGMEIEDNVPLTESETKGMFIDILCSQKTPGSTETILCSRVFLHQLIFFSQKKPYAGTFTPAASISCPVIRSL